MNNNTEREFKEGTNKEQTKNEKTCVTIKKNIFDLEYMFMTYFWDCVY